MQIGRCSRPPLNTNRIHSRRVKLASDSYINLQSCSSLQSCLNLQYFPYPSPGKPPPPGALYFALHEASRSATRRESSLTKPASSWMAPARCGISFVTSIFWYTGLPSSSTASFEPNTAPGTTSASSWAMKPSPVRLHRCSQFYT